MRNRLTAPNQVDATAERRYERPLVRWPEMCRLLIASGVVLLLIAEAADRRPNTAGAWHCSNAAVPGQPDRVALGTRRLF